MSRGGSGTITLSSACLSLAGAFTMMPSSDKTKCHLRTRSCWRVSHQESTFYSVKVGLSIRPERAYPPLPFWLFPLVLSKQLDFIWNNFQHSLIGSFGTRKGKGKKNPGMGILEPKGSFILETKKLRPEADEPGQGHTPRAKKSPKTGLSSPHSSELCPPQLLPHWLLSLLWPSSFWLQGPWIYHSLNLRNSPSLSLASSWLHLITFSS